MAPQEHPLLALVVGDVEEARRLLPRFRQDQAALDRFAAIAASNGQLGILELLRGAGANLRANDELALRLAVSSGRMGVFDYLVAQGASVESCTRTLVQSAARNGHVRMLERLEALGSDLAPCRELLEELASKPSLAAVRRHLESLIPGLERLARLLAAVRTGRLAAAKAALPNTDLAAGAGILLETAVRARSLRILRFLYESGADLALHKARVMRAAAEEGCYDVLHALITRYGCDPALYPGLASLAAENGHIDCLILLWTSGAAKHPVSGMTLKLAELNGYEESHDYLTYAGGMDSIAEHRKAIQAMVERVLRSPPIYRPSELWTFFNQVNLEQLRRFGLARFKRTVNQNYFNYLPLGPRDPQLRGLLKGLGRRFPIRTVLGMRMTDPDRYRRSGRRVADDARVFRLWQDLPILAKLGPFVQRTFYRLLVGMLWRYAERHDTLNLRQTLQEPRLGSPIVTATRERLISQDLAHSILECNAILDGMPTGSGAPVARIAEVGAGYGRVGDVLLSNRNCRYFVFDIPPSLYISQWYLRSRHPDKRVFRFRDFERFDEIEAELAEAGIAFFTPDQIALFPDGYFDIAVNISSLHEMRHEQMEHLLSQMYRISAQRVYIKQYRQYENPWDKIQVTESDYPVPPGWEKRLWRNDRVDDRFFEAVVERSAPLPAALLARPRRAPKRPTVSILLANYNDAKFLPTSLEGVLAQTDPADEVIVVDDGSTDDSVQIIEHMLARHPKARLVRQGRNRGQHAAIQRALLEATSDYVAWASSDDFLLPQFIQRSRAALQLQPGCGLCFSRLCAWVDGTGEVKEYSERNHGAAFDLGSSAKYFSPDDLHNVLSKNYVWISGNTVLARRDLLIETGGFEASLRWHADWFAFYAIALRAGAVGIPETLALMREHPSTYSRDGMRNRKRQDEVLGALFDLLHEPRNSDLEAVLRTCPSMLSPFGREVVYAGIRRPRHWAIAAQLTRWHAKHTLLPRLRLRFPAQKS